MPRSKSSHSSSFWDHPIATIEEALSIRKQIERLQSQLTKTLGTTTSTVAEVVMGKSKARKKMSPAGRAKIAAAQRARWAKSKGTAVAKETTQAVQQAAKPAKSGKLTPAG